MTTDFEICVENLICIAFDAGRKMKMGTSTVTNVGANCQRLPGKVYLSKKM